MLRVIKSVAVILGAVAVAACGSGTTFEPLQPARFFAVGDGLTAQTPGARYTVNDNSPNIWVEQVAANYGRSIGSSAAGGLNFAVGNACVTSTADSCGATSLASQVSSVLAAAPGGNDVVLVGAGISDAYSLAQRRAAGTITDADLRAGMQTAAREFAAQIRRLVSGGVKYVVIAGSYDFGRSPYAITAARTTLLTDASQRDYNDQIKVLLNDLGANVLYVDAAAHYNLRLNSPSSYSLSNVRDAVCNNAGDANACTPSTVVNANYNAYLFADNRHITPKEQRDFGSIAYDRIRNRW
jgi:outer membrane lipase/esterase